MGFWEEQAQRESAELMKERLPQNAPQECEECGVVSIEVMFGSCLECS